MTERLGFVACVNLHHSAVADDKVTGALAAVSVKERINLTACTDAGAA